MLDELLELAAKTKYPIDAFLFVQKGLDFTVRRTHGEPEPDADITSRHVSGQQLCEGLRDYALQEYGMMARTVLKRWHITESEDFGHIVFAMVEADMMQKTDDDLIDDFTDVFDFHDAFSPHAAFNT